MLFSEGITAVEIKSWKGFTAHAEFMEVQLITSLASHSKCYLTQYKEQSEETFCSPLSALHSETTSAELNSNLFYGAPRSLGRKYSFMKPVLQKQSAL